MKKIVIVCGLIGGGIIVILMVSSMALYFSRGNFEGGMLVGYASMILAFSMIFAGVKNFRDKHNNGVVSFGKAFKIGLFITLIASTIYVITWLIEYYYFMPDFMDKYSDIMLKKISSSKVSQVEIDKKISEVAYYKEMYKNPFFVILITYSEILPVGLIISLISALVLKRKQTNKNFIVSN